MLPGLKVEWVDVDTGTSKFDLTFVVQDFGGGLAARVEYNSDLFDAGTMERLLEHFENLLRGIAAHPSQRLSELPLLRERRSAASCWWNGMPTQRNIRATSASTNYSRRRSREHPDAVAVVFGGETLTYAELNARANQLAHCLLAPQPRAGRARRHLHGTIGADGRRLCWPF